MGLTGERAEPCTGRGAGIPEEDDQEGAEHDDQLIADAAGVVVEALAEASTD